MNDAIKMQISAFVDGELPQNEAELLLRRLCQDVELRQQAAEYLAMGRVMRGERMVAHTSALRGRIAAALDDKTLQEGLDDSTAAAPRYMRPVAGIAIAATVAMVALFGLQQVADAPDADSVAGAAALVGEVDDSYTVPAREDDLLRDYYLRHSASSSHIGADSINARLVTLQLWDGVVVDTEVGEIIEDDDQDAEIDATAETPAP